MSFLSSPKTLQDAPPYPNRRRRILIAWLLVAIWAGVIWILGGEGFSAGETGSFLSKLLRSLGIEIPPAQRWKLSLVIRKFAHLVEYAILAFLAFRAALLSAGRNQIAAAAWTALFLVALLAMADEARQAFLTSRTGSPVDVIIDVTGGTIAIVSLLLLMRRIRASAA